MTIIRSALAAVLALGFLAPPLAAEGQQAEKVRQIGVLSFGEPEDREVRAGNDTFEQALRDLGWVRGRNLAVEYRYGRGRDDALPSLCEDLIRVGVDLIVAITGPAARAAKDATAANNIPVVMPEIAAKNLQLLREMLPGVTRVAVLWNSAAPAKEVDLKAVKTAALGLGMGLQLPDVRSAAQLDSRFKEAHAGGLIIIGDALTFQHRARIAALAAARRLPAIYDYREYADAGGLIAYGPSRLEGRRRAATYVDKILKGARTADLPVEQPTKFELVINLKALGLTIPQSLLLRADELIQ